MTTSDDDRPKRLPVHQLGQELGTLSLDELSERIASLKDEIARIEAAIRMKRDSAAAADAFFKR